MRSIHCITAIILMSMVSVGVGDESDYQDILHRPGNFSAENFHFPGPDFSVNTFNGNLGITQNLIRLPGRNKLDLDLTLRYNSKNARVAGPTSLLRDKGCFGRGWSLQFGRLDPIAREVSLENDVSLAYGKCKEINSGSVYYKDVHVTEGFDKLYRSGSSTFEMIRCGGRRFYRFDHLYESISYVTGSHLNGIYATGIYSDRQDSIRIEYLPDSYKIHHITDVLGRVVNVLYYSSGFATGMVNAIQYPGLGGKTLEIRFFYDATGTALTRLELPNGQSIRFEYENGNEELTKITYSTGGIVSFSYGSQLFLDFGGPQGSPADQVMVKCIREVKTDYDGDGMDERIRYDYSSQDLYPYLYQTTITDQYDHQTVIMHEHINSRNNLKSRAGRVREKYYYNGAANPANLLKTELNVWGRYQVVYNEDNNPPIFTPVLYQSALIYADSGTVTQYEYDGIPNPSGMLYEYRVGYNEDYNVDFTEPRMMSFKNTMKKIRYVNAKNIRIDISNRNFDILDVLLFDDSECRTRSERYAWVASPDDRMDIGNYLMEYYGWYGYKFFLFNYYVNLQGYYEKTASDGSALYKNYLYDTDLSKTRTNDYGYLKTTHDGFLNQVLTSYSDHQPAGIPDSIFMEYDNFGNLIKYRGVLGQVTQWVYGSEYNHAFPTRQSNSVYGVDAVAAYDLYTGLLTRYQDANDDVTEYVYDDMNNLTVVRKPGDDAGYPSVKISYNYAQRKIEYLSKKTSTGYYDPVVYHFNLYGMLSQIQRKIDDQNTSVKDLLYDRCNRQYLESDSYTKTGVIGTYFTPDTTVDHRLYFYDAFGRITRTVFPKNTETAYSTVRVSHEGLKEFHRDENDHLTKISRNLENKATRTVQYAGQDSVVVTKTFDGFGYPARVFDPNGQITRYNYSDIGEMLYSDSPDGGLETCMYINNAAEACRLVEKVDGKISDHEDYASHLKTYDGLNRLKSHGLSSDEVQIQKTQVDGFENGDEGGSYIFVNQQLGCDVYLTWNSEHFRISDFEQVHEGVLSAHIDCLEPGEGVVLEYRFEPCLDLGDVTNLAMFILENPDQENLYPFALISTVQDIYMNESVYTPPSGGPLGVWRETSVFVIPDGSTNIQWNRIKTLKLAFVNPSTSSSSKFTDPDDGDQIEGIYPKSTRDFYLDELNVTIEKPGETQIVYRAAYDQGVTGFQSNPKGHLAGEETFSSSTPEELLNSAVYYDYDDRERVKKIQINNRGLQKEFLYTYDYSDNITQITYPDGFIVSHEYDGSQRLVTVNDKSRNQRIAKLSYNSKGLLKCIYYHNGIYAGYNYDFFTYYPRNWLKVIQFRRYKYVTSGGGILKLSKEVLPVTGTHTSETIWQKYYLYDNTGNILQIRNNSLTGDLHSEYGYDELNRLTLEKNYPVRTSTRNWTYDRSGNITTLMMDDGMDPYYRHFTYNSLLKNRLEQSDMQGAITQGNERSYIDIQYDQLGNMTGYRWYENTAQGECNYTFNLLGQLMDVFFDDWTDNTRDVRCRFAYDYHGNKVYSEVNGKRTWYFYVNNKLMAEFDDDMNVKYYYIYANDRRVARRSASGVYHYYRTDHLGSVRMITDYKGNPICSYDYYAFGEDRVITGQSTNQLKFTGKEEIPVPGIYYFGARYYDPVLGRWLSTDPAGQYHSPYVYVGNNPIRIVDSDGRYGIDVHYDLTYYMSVAVMGVSNETAAAIASANQGVDDRFSSSPWNPFTWSKSKHFESSVSLGRITALENNAMYLSDEYFGAYLHSFQDAKFAHDGFKAIGGPGLFGHILALNEPDNVGVKGNRGRLKPKTINMIKGVYEIMKKRNGGRANISLEELLKILSDYAANNNEQGFKNVQSLVNGETRKDDEGNE